MKIRVQKRMEENDLWGRKKTVRLTRYMLIHAHRMAVTLGAFYP